MEAQVFADKVKEINGKIVELKNEIYYLREQYLKFHKIYDKGEKLKITIFEHISKGMFSGNKLVHEQVDYAFYVGATCDSRGVISLELHKAKKDGTESQIKYSLPYTEYKIEKV